MTPFRISIFAAIAAFFLLAAVFELMRSRRLQERYALLWLLPGVVVLGFAIWRDALGKVSDLVGISYPPSTLFLLASLFAFVMLLHYSTVVSKLSEQNTILAQRLALLEHRLEDTSGAPEEGSPR
jgi:hypothetical protein